ncbi:alpha/beta hydrolase [alpha proteobacterium AAP81b]|nr:alpha/beta hydrolase [alpha proteobacterium AAP81b]
MSPTAPAPAARWPRRLAIALAALVALLAIAFAVFRTPDIPVATLRAKYGSPASRYLEITPGQILHLRDEGPRTGFPVLLLHGSNASLHTWQPWTDRLIAAGYRVVRFDFPGHGLSSPAPSRDYSAAAYVAVTDLVAQRLGLSRFAVAGNSMGGGVAWKYAVAHPGKVAALVLVDASGQPAPKGSDLPIGFRIARMPVIRDLATAITPRSLLDKSLHQSVSVQAVASPAAVDRYWELLRYPGNRAATLDRFSQTPPPPDEAGLRAITAPTLILWGREDRLIPVSSADWFKAHLPRARVTILDGIGHIPMEEAPDASLAPVLGLLEEVAR